MKKAMCVCVAILTFSAFLQAGETTLSFAAKLRMKQVDRWDQKRMYGKMPITPKAEAQEKSKKGLYELFEYVKKREKLNTRS